MSLERIAGWTLTELPRLNRAVLFGGAPPRVLVDELGEVLPDLPAPERLPPSAARRLLVLLGFAGASVARHRQAGNSAIRAVPERAFDGVDVSPDRVPFPRYFARLADQTATGHCHRDSFASLVRWNVDTTDVTWRGETLAVIPGAFDDGHVRTYAGATGEERFFELVKKGEAIELAINAMLEPLSDGDVDIDSDEGVRRARVATALLDALRNLFHEFIGLPDSEAMSPAYFMDVFRQFAVHWTATDIPPSGALDPEALKRDFLLGIAIPGYAHHVRKVFPALLMTEQADLERLMRRPPLPVTLLHSLGLVPPSDGDPAGPAATAGAALAAMSDAELDSLVARHPVLTVWYRLLAAHSRAAGAHLMISKRFLFKPQTQREVSGEGDAELVSNRRGTTGMDESLLERLTRARKDHVLSSLKAATTRTGGPPPSQADTSPADAALVRIGAR